MSREAESALLGSLMLSNAAFWKVADKVCAADFSDERHARLFAVIGDLTKEGQPADGVTVGERDESLAVMAMAYQSQTPSAAGAMTYAEIVRQHAEARRLKRAGQTIATCDSYEAAQGILAAVRPTQSQQLKTVSQGLAEMVDGLQARFDADGDISGIPTGLASLDAITAGWQPGNLIVCAARPGMGKSAFALQAAIAAGRSLFFSLEMTAGELMERAVANVGQIPHRWLRFPKDAPDYALENITTHARTVAKLPLLLDDRAGRDIDAICSLARQAHMQEPLRLIVVDHLGIIARPGKHDPSELGVITAQLKRLAKDLGVPVLLLCQLNRGVEGRPEKRPNLSDLRDSGRIEEDADVVLCLYRDEFYTPQGSPLAGYFEAIVRKNRSGELGTAWAKSLLAQMRLEPCNEPERSPVPAANDDRRGGFQTRSLPRRLPAQVS